MIAISAPVPVSPVRLRTGAVLTALPVLFLAFDGAVKFTTIEPVVDSMAQLGYPVQLAPVIGAIELLCVALYAIPQTAVLGAVLLTGFLGGAITTHLRVGDPLMLYTLFPIYVAAFVWGGLFLREPRLQALLPRRR